MLMPRTNETLWYVLFLLLISILFIFSTFDFIVGFCSPAVINPHLYAYPTFVFQSNVQRWKVMNLANIPDGMRVCVCVYDLETL